MRLRQLELGGRLDLYVARTFLVSYGWTMFSVVGLFVVLDLAANLDGYLDPNRAEPAGFGTIGLFYLLNLPFTFLQVAPFITLLAGQFSVSRLLGHLEFHAAVGVGISPRRFVAPIFVLAALFAAGSTLMREFALDGVAELREDVRYHLEEGTRELVLEDVWLRDPTMHLVHVERYTEPRDGAPMIEGIEASVFEGGLLRRLRAKRARFEGGRWRLEGGTFEIREAEQRTVRPIDVLTPVAFSPADVRLAWRADKHPIELTGREAAELSRRDPDNTQLETLLQGHLASPFASLILLAIGIPIVLLEGTGRSVRGLGFGFLLCLAYYVAALFLRSLGMSGQLSPMLSGWLPTTAFGSLAVVLLGSMR